MKSATMPSNVLKRENASASANVLMCKQWWKVCWMYGDQEKYYRQLYAKRAVNLKAACETDGVQQYQQQQQQQQQTQQQTFMQHEENYENTQGKRFAIKQMSGSVPDVTSGSSAVLGSLDLTSGINE